MNKDLILPTIIVGWGLGVFLIYRLVAKLGDSLFAAIREIRQSSKEIEKELSMIRIMIDKSVSFENYKSDVRKINKDILDIGLKLARMEKGEPAHDQQRES